MTTQLLLVQALNGLQYGVLLFLVAAGLTLIFGVMDFINLAHGVQYMLGAYLGAGFAALTGSFWLGLLLALPAALASGLALEWLVFRHLYDRDHLSQVLATFEDDAPALAAARRGNGRVLLFTSTADRDWSDFAIRTSFLPLMQRFSAYLTGSLEEREEQSPLQESDTRQVEPGSKLALR